MSTSTTLIKAVNSKVEKVHGMTEAALEISYWRGTCNLMVIPLDDFKVILGLEFLLKAKVMIIPHLGGMLIRDEESPCFVPTLQKTRGAKKCKEEQGMLSAKQLDQGVRKGHTTYVAALVQIEPDVATEIPAELAEVLQEYADLMPAELPKELPPRRAYDHHIDMEPGARLPAKALYHMVPLELAELRTQLDDLLAA